ncbi:MAG: TetR family transcriptional regulator C-terminal domain-containing protein [Bacilli bacterium]|nr:TetR family transcriptional regulator C-terminal domain-containing protein [Bacilli bacterium]
MRRKDCPAEFIKECMAQALFQIMLTKKFEDVTISEICKVAGFGRTTYYHYFTNRTEELISYYLDKKWTEKVPTFHEGDDPIEWLRVIFNTIYLYKEQLTSLYKQGLLEIALDVIFEGIEKTYLLNNDPYFSAWFAGALYGVIREWVKNSFNVSPDDLVDAVKVSFSR